LCPDDTFLWVCFFCNNQYRIKDAGSQVSPQELKSTFEHSLEQVGQMVIMLNDFFDPMYISRAWCIFETYICVTKGLPMTMIVPPAAQADFKRKLDNGVGLAGVQQKFEAIDSKHSRSTKPEDAQLIHELIEQTYGFEAVNQQVKVQLLHCLTLEFQNYMMRGTRQA